MPDERRSARPRAPARQPARRQSPPPPNAILLGLAPGANSLSGRARLDPSHTQSEAASHDSAETKEPKLSRKMSEREAERTRHVLESIIYYAVPIKPMPQTQAGETKNGSIGTTSLTDRATGADRKHGRDANLSRSPKLQRRTSREGYASDPENATSRKSTARSPEHSVAARHLPRATSRRRRQRLPSHRTPDDENDAKHSRTSRSAYSNSACARPR